MDSELSRISTLPQKDKSSAYSQLLSSTISTSSSLPSDLDQFLSLLVAPDFPQIVARQVLQEYVSQVAVEKEGKTRDREIRKEILRKSLERLQPRVNSFESEVCVLREKYADLLEEDEEFPEAAKVLIGIPLESGSRSDDYKLKVYIRIVRLFLEEEDSTSADTYFNRASLLAHNLNASNPEDLETLLQFKLCQARMFDFSRRFAEAASKYHEISYVSVLAEEERLQALSAAIVCAVLAPAGPTRSRILSSLYRDERSPSTSHYSILSKMFLDHLIRPSEITSFSSSLSPHQLARLPPIQPIITPLDEPEEEGKKGPETVLDRAMMEHNILAVSRVYNNITFEGLGGLLGMRPSAAEAMARGMIQQKRLVGGSIDQIDRIIIFDVEEKEGGDGIVSNVAQQAGGQGKEEEDGVMKEEKAHAPATKRWDLMIRQTLQLAETVAARCEALLELGNNAEVKVAA
ncbi:uncharacterized protein JCM6883_004535 [Sporobolomyces salmoneus]|uniref:uncharacterized protein n=1 Tax=Sporobolomyces salmoneus TaxID=183962 RepID=UPI00317C7212